MAVSSAGAERLRTIIVADVASATAATVFVLFVYLTVMRSPYLILLAGLVAGSGIVMAAGLPALRNGHVDAAVLLLAAANWGVAIAAATIATFCWPLMMLAAVMPCVFAAPFIGGRRLAGYVAMSVAVSLGVVAVGVYQDVTGFSDEVPQWLRDVVLTFFAPWLVAIVALIAVLNSVSMQRVVASVVASRAALAEQADELRRSRARVVAATDRERRKIERDLHDGAQQRLIGIGIGLSRAKELCGSDPAAAVSMLDLLREELRVAHDEVRDLAQGVYPPVLTEHGLDAALQSAADRSPLPVTVDLDPLGRHRPDVEAALYFCAVEALQNAAKHSRASKVTLSAGRDDSTLWISVADDGVGFDDPDAQEGTGLLNIADRLGAIGGRVDVTAAPGRGTAVRASVPLG